MKTLRNFWSINRIFIELLIYFGLLFLFNKYIVIKLESDYLGSILSVSGFIFGVILAFSIANRRDRLNAIRASLRRNDGIYLGIYEMSKMVDTKTSNDVRQKIDNVLTAQIDYNLMDIAKTTPLLKELFEYVRGITHPKVDHMIRISLPLFEIQKDLTYRLNDRMRRIEWVAMYLLSVIIILLLNVMNTGTTLSILIVSILGTGIALFFIFLRELDNLSWRERHWVWNPLIDIFNELDLLPYFPEDLYNARKISIAKLNPMKEYRLAKYKHPYPNFEDKEIEIKGS